MKPPFTYFGGKTAIAGRIAALLPAHEHYVEPFAGSLAVLLAKKPAPMETVNDLDGDLMNFWRVLRDQPGDLERVCALTPHSRAEHAMSRDLEVPSDLERARRVWVRLTQDRGRSMRFTGWQYKTDRGEGSRLPVPDYLATCTSRIVPAAARLARVSLECGSALDVIARYGRTKAVLIYADPPYLGSSRLGSPEGYTAEMLTEPGHRQLADALRAADAAVVLSGYDTPLYAGLYADWHRVTLAAYCGNGVNRTRAEVLWSNRPFPHYQPGLDETASEVTA